MIDDVIARLASFGYIVASNDFLLIEFLIPKVENRIKNNCNIDIIPDGLHDIAVDMVVGEFLFTKKSIGRLEGFDLDIAVKQISEGDTSVTFAIGEGSSTSEQRLDRLIDYLLNSGKDELIAYRCIKW